MSSGRADFSATAAKHTLNATGEAAAGALTGVAVRFAVAPLDIIKIRFQLQRQPVSRRLVRGHAPELSGGSSVGRHVGIWGTTKSLIAEEGVRTLWRGNVPAMFLYGLYSSAQITTFRYVVEEMADAPASARNFVGGFAAGTFATTATYPLDVLRTRFAAQGMPRAYASLTHMVQRIAAEEGTAGFFKGILPSIVQIGPAMGLTFALYGLIRDRNGRVVQPSSAPRDDAAAVPRAVLDSGWRLREMLASSAAGLFSGFTAKMVMYPFDTVKKRLQIQGMERHHTYGEHPPYKGMLDCMRQTYAHEGAAGLYKGAVPSMIKSAVITAATFLLYENVVTVMQERGVLIKESERSRRAEAAAAAS